MDVMGGTGSKKTLTIQTGFKIIRPASIAQILVDVSGVVVPRNHRYEIGHERRN